MATKIKGLTVEFDGDTTSLKKAINDTLKECRQADQALRNINSALKLDPTNVELIKSKMEVLSKEIRVSEEALSKLQKIQKDLDKNNVEKTSKEYTSLQQQITKTATSLEKYRKEQSQLKLDIIKNSPDGMKELADATKKASDELERLNQERTRLEQEGVDKSSEEYKQLAQNIALTSDELKDLQGLSASMHLEQLGQKAQEASDHFRQLYESTRFLSKLSLSALAGIVTSTSQYETSVAKIKKIYHDLSDETVDDLKQIAVATASSFDAIAEYATIGAALGIAEEDLSEFTKTMKELETVTDGTINGEEGGKMVARFLNVMGLGTEDVHRFGSALTVVEDSLAVTADEVLQVSSRLGGLSAIGNVTQHDVIGIASELMNLGLRAESSASAVTRSFMMIETESAKGSEKFKRFAEVAGMTADEFTQAWEKEPMEAFLKFTDGLKSKVFQDMGEAIRNGTADMEGYAKALDVTNEELKEMWSSNAKSTFDQYVNSMENLEDDSESTAKILNDLGLAGVRTAETLLKLAGNGDMVRKMINESSKAWNENTALTDKANYIYETAAAKWEMVKESAKQLGDTLGQSVLPFVKTALDMFRELLEGLQNIPEPLKIVANGLLGVGVVSAPAFKGLSVINKAMAESAKTGKGVGNVFIKIKDAISDASGKTSLFGSMLQGIIPIAGAVGLGLGAIFVAYQASLETTRRKTDQFFKEWEQRYEQLQRSANENFKGTAFELDRINTDDLEKMVEERLKYVAAGRDAENIEESIKNKVDQINTALGTTAFSFDETTGKILYEGEEVDNLTEKYRQLADARKVDMWLEDNKAMYQEMLAAPSEIIEQTKQAKQAFDEVYDDLDKYNKALFDRYKNGQMSLEELNSYSDNVAFNGAIRAWETYGHAIDEANSHMAEAKEFVSLYEEIADPENVNALSQIQQYINGTYIPQDQLDNLETLYDTYNNIKKDKEDLLAMKEQGLDVSDEEIIALEQREAELWQMITDLERGIDDANAQAQTGTQETVGAITKTFADNMPVAIAKPIIGATQLAIQKAQEMWENFHLGAKSATISVGTVVTGLRSYNQSGQQGYGAFEPPATIYQPYAVQVKDTISKMDTTLSRSEQNFDVASQVAKALKNLQAQVIVNVDMDGRAISSQISAIQGLNIKKQNS